MHTTFHCVLQLASLWWSSQQVSPPLPDSMRSPLLLQQQCRLAYSKRRQDIHLAFLCSFTTLIRVSVSPLKRKALMKDKSCKRWPCYLEIAAKEKKVDMIYCCVAQHQVRPYWEDAVVSLGATTFWLPRYCRDGLPPHMTDQLSYTALPLLVFTYIISCTGRWANSSMQLLLFISGDAIFLSVDQVLIPCRSD